VRTILLDGDILTYRIAHQHQVAIEWDEETWSFYGDLTSARRSIDLWLTNLRERLDADNIKVYLSDAKFNWRHQVLPTYKGNRAAWAQVLSMADPLFLPKPGPQRPLLHKALRDLLRQSYGAEQAGTLEADDLLGIRSTEPGGGERIIVSPDKDMRTIPGLLYNPDKPKAGIERISEAQADWYHLFQTLVGDTTDNYSGCKGIGEAKAPKLLPSVSEWDGTKAWASVVDAFLKAGFDEEYALVQARMAHVLRHGDYNEETNEVRLWQPA